MRATGLANNTALVDLAHRSHQIIVTHQHAGGAYPASPTFSAYAGYAWFRDGAFTAEGISRYGDVQSANRFHDWARDVLVDRRGRVADLLDQVEAGERPSHEQMLPTRFTLDGLDGSDPWWDFQTDGYGTWLWAVAAHADRHGQDLYRWLPGIEVAVDYLTAFWDLPCYDWWEEHVEQQHISTLGAIYGGLTAAAPYLDTIRAAATGQVAGSIRAKILSEGVQNSHLTKWIGVTTVDGSLPSCIVPFGVVAPGSPLAASTLDKIQQDLERDGGVHRFRADVFYGGGQWLLLAALLGWNHAAAGDSEKALHHLHWIAAQQTLEGALPEQVPTHLLAPGHRQEWLDKWGTVATPLLWSHGMYLILANELGLI